MNDRVSKISVYEKLRSELPALIGNQTDFLANISNFAALLFNTLPSLNWAGFYLLRGTDLVLGPFQGKPACSCIAMGDGVCGLAALQRAAEVYPHRDVALSAQTYLEPFYRGLGFAAISAPYDDCGVPHVDMIGPARGV